MANEVIRVMLNDSFQPVDMQVSEFENLLWEEYDLTDDEEERKNLRFKIFNLRRKYGRFIDRKIPNDNYN